ncbi:hypothetical protein ACH5RR_032114 [Cinchona calisaya]|uniref:Exocyst subunit Exo70 family protein n=1 Tax=Cinchona calisaya TaxID=153742 RepID=A0ABD2YLJ9_9GENT
MGSSLSLQSLAKPVEPLTFSTSHCEISQSLPAIDQVKPSDDGTKLNNEVLVQLNRLKDEFQTILRRHTDSVKASGAIDLSSTSDTPTPGYGLKYEDYVDRKVPKSEVIDSLRSIVEKMNSWGFLNVCKGLYVNTRKPFVDTIIEQLQFEELSRGTDSKRLLREELKSKVEWWILASKLCIEMLFPRERVLSNQIFKDIIIGSTAIDEECFLEIVKDAAVKLFTFPEAVSKGHPSSDKMETILLLYDALLTILPEVNALFHSRSAETIRNHITLEIFQIGNSVKRMLTDFQTSVLHELSSVSESEGIVHPLTTYVMEYITLLVNYKKILTDLIVSNPLLGGEIIPDEKLYSLELEGKSPLAVHLIVITEVLQLNLQRKSNYYQDPSLGCLFMTNNILYIVQKMEGFKELEEMIGADYLKKLTDNMRQVVTNHHRSTCERLLDCLRDEGLYLSWCFATWISKRALRKRMEAFNSALEKLHHFRSSMTHVDLEFLEELHESSLDKLIPAYEQFLEKLCKHINSRRIRSICVRDLKRPQCSCIKYSSEDLKTLI